MADSPTSDATPNEHRLTLATIDWPVVIGIGAVHLGCLLAPFYFSWSALAVAAVLTWLTGAVGITLCYHRLLTHRSFRTPKWFEYALTALGCAAFQGGPVQWVGTHRLHHRYSDEPDDPHSPKHGFSWSHMFWCMKRNCRHPDRSPARAARDLCKDPGIRLINRFHIVPQVVVIMLLFVLGEAAAMFLGWSTSGVSWLVWGVCVRTVLVYHVTWLVNSATHTWGYRNYDTTDQSTNLWWVGILAFGEGWHNNHHGDQRAAAHGRRWFEFDMTYLTIRLLALVGLARDIVKTRQKLEVSKPAAVPDPLIVPGPSRAPGQA